MSKEIITFGDSTNSIFIKILIFFKDVGIDNALMSNKIYSDEKNYKYFIGFLCGGCKIKPFHLIQPNVQARM